MRCLLVRERVIPLDRTDEYRAAWSSITTHATAASANAWVFRSAAADDRFMEFVEWQCGDDTPAAASAAAGVGAPGPPPAISAELARLDTIAPPLTGSMWKEWKT